MRGNHRKPGQDARDRRSPQHRPCRVCRGYLPERAQRKAALALRRIENSPHDPMPPRPVPTRVTMLPTRPVPRVYQRRKTILWVLRKLPASIRQK